jgi:hypothetical protein
MILFFNYLAWKVINVLASFQNNREPMMTVEHRSVWPGLQGAELSRMKRGHYRSGRETAKRVELHWVQSILGMQES